MLGWVQMKLLYAALLFVSAFCSAQCKSATATLNVKIEASESDKKLLIEKLKEHGCNHGLGIEPTDEGFDYCIAIAEVEKPRMTLTQAGIGSASQLIVSTTVYDANGTKLFDFGRGNRLTRRGFLNASAKEIVKRLRALQGKRNGATLP